MSGDIKQMNSEIKNSLLDEVSVRKKAALKRQIFAELVKHSKIELPKSLVSMEINRMMQTMQQNIERARRECLRILTSNLKCLKVELKKRYIAFSIS